MDDITVNIPPPKKKWPRVIAWVFAGLIVLLVALYFVGTSTWCLQKVILPQVSKSLHADVTVSDAAIHPFREVTLRGLKVQAKGQPPVLTVPEVRVRYHLFQIIGGNLHVDEITLTDPTVLLVENPDGTSNVDALKQKEAKPAEKPQEKAKPSKPPRILLAKLTLSNATIRQEKIYSANQRDLTELANVNVELDNLGNNQQGRLTVKADLQATKNPPAPASAGLAEAKMTSGFNFTMSADFKPVSVQGQTEIVVARAEGNMAQLAGSTVSLNCDIGPSEIKNVAVRVQRSGELLAELAARGPFDMEKQEGRLKVELSSVDKRLLNLLGGTNGLDFGTTSITSTNEIQLAKTTITAQGRVDVDKMQIARAGRKTPMLDLHSAYDISVDTAQSNLLLKAFTLQAAQNGAALLHGELTSPMNIAWGNASQPAGDSALNLSVTNLSLNDWTAFAGDSAIGGQVSLQAHVQSRQGGQRLSFDMDAQMAGLTMAVGSNHISDAGVHFMVRGEAADMKQFKLAEYSAQLTHSGQSALSLTGSGDYDTSSGNADMQVALQSSLAALMDVMPQPGARASAGTVELKAHLAQKENKQTVTGNLRLADFTGQFGQTTFDAFGTTVDFDLGKNPSEIQLNKVSGSFTAHGKPAGAFDASGSSDVTNKSSKLNATLTGWNQDFLRPFLEPMLTGKKLQSIVINGKVAAQYDPSGSSAIQASVQVTNLVVNDPSGQIPATPLEAMLDVDGAVQKQVMDLRHFEVTLTPTARAQNKLRLEGHVDFTQTNAIQGKVQLAADSVDVTTYYDLFTSKKGGAEKKPEEPGAPQQPAAQTSSAPAQEPAPVHLPFRQFSVEATIGKFYLHEVEITNLRTMLNLDGSRVLLKPFELTLNGAPMNATADLDLSMPGYKYAVGFNADQVPFAPLVDTFQPERRGQLGGTLTAHAQIKGQGITGPSLQKNLSGQFDVGTTNLNLSVVNIKSPILKTIVNVVGTLPELLRNPTAAIGSLLGSVTGKGGLTHELEQSPINVISARGSAGAGKVNLQDAVIQSSAFMAEAHGDITLAPGLTNSAIQIPVQVSLSRSVAQQVNLAASTGEYSKLPDFLTIKGTVGNPKADINKVALLGTTLKAFTGSGQGTNSNTGSLIQGLSGLLGGQPRSNSPSTNAPANRAAPLNNLLNNFLKKK